MGNFVEYLEELKLSLQYHDKLNPELWDGETLKPEVRKALIRFGETWAQFAKIPKSMIKDMVMTGGNANFNYTGKSDIDVHLIIQRSKLFSDSKYVEEYLQDKKSLWTLTHNITVYGYPLEPYAQDTSITYPRYQGVYSLMKDDWVVKPVRTRYDFTNDHLLKQKVRHFMHAIDSMIKNKMGDAPIQNMKQRFKDMRTSSIQKHGEFGRENLVFKELRNRGYLDKMTKYEKSLKDQELTLPKK
jgi:hypothetical protein